MGDMHFSQGDGEVSFCGAIEMSGWLDLRCTVIKGGMKLLPAVGPSELNVNPIFEIGPLEPRYSEWLVFEGISVDENGKQHYLDATIAYKRAVLNCIKYLSQFGYSEEQVYLLLSCCPCEGRISGIVDVVSLPFYVSFCSYDLQELTLVAPLTAQCSVYTSHSTRNL